VNCELNSEPVFVSLPIKKLSKVQCNRVSLQLTDRVFGIAGKIVVAKVRSSQQMNIWIIAEKCLSQLSRGKISWKLWTVKQQTGTKDLATVHLV